MSHYIERVCAEHGYWDEDVDVPEEACPKCIKEGKFKTRAQLLDAVAGLEAELAACRATRTAPEAARMTAGRQRQADAQFLYNQAKEGDAIFRRTAEYLADLVSKNTLVGEELPQQE